MKSEPILELRMRYTGTDPKPWALTIIYHSGKSRVRWYKSAANAWRRWYFESQDLTA